MVFIVFTGTFAALITLIKLEFSFVFGEWLDANGFDPEVIFVEREVNNIGPGILAVCIYASEKILKGLPMMFTVDQDILEMFTFIKRQY